MTRYEIFRDVLGAAILDWRRRQELVRQQKALLREHETQRREELREIEARRQRERARYLRISRAVLSIGVVALLGLAIVAYQAASGARSALALA